ncbi:MAG: hypothetical protein ACLRTA_07375 [Clostridia bacterium]
MDVDYGGVLCQNGNDVRAEGSARGNGGNRVKIISKIEIWKA